uniref:CSON008171 protein n=1 Tax=Culicoides sonorensis TaxID=179676 RepID=A0A336MWD3_CULSO
MTVLENIITGVPHDLYISIINGDLRNGTPIAEDLPLHTLNAGHECQTESLPHCEKADLDESNRTAAENRIHEMSNSCCLLARI